jgi:methylated-DNA-[protein]-cysteine S-methyltransferase
MTLASTVLATPLGPMLAASDGAALAGLWFQDQRHFPAAAAVFVRRDELPVFVSLRAMLDRYFAGDADDAALPRLPLAPSGTPFQARVWAALREIPRGTTLTYAQVAERISAPHAVRAVGAAVGRNPVSVLIPCHRVVGTNGSLTGYAGGLDRKRALLAIEGVAGLERFMRHGPAAGSAASQNGGHAAAR